MKSQNNKFDEIDNMLFDYFKENKDIPKDTENLLNNIKYTKHKTHFGIGKVAIILVTLSTLTTGIVFAKDIASFFKAIFGLSSLNIDNEGVIEAIDNKNYIQNIDNEYIAINSDYGIKNDYLLKDDINLYLVFNLYSNNEIIPEYRLSIPDLIIKNENNEIIYSDNDDSTILNLVAVKGNKKIVTENNHEKRELIFIMSNGYPQIGQLNISFNKVILYNDKNPGNDYITLDCNCDFNIDLIQKFINREIYEFCTFESTSDYTIVKCITTDTGTYIVLNTSRPETNFNLLINGTTYNGTKHLLGIKNERYEFLYQYNIAKDSIDINNIITLQDDSGLILNITK